MGLYNLYNPTKHRCVVFDALPESNEPVIGKMVVVEPGETLTGVALAGHVADRLRALPAGASLTVTDAPLRVPSAAPDAPHSKPLPRRPQE